MNLKINESDMPEDVKAEIISETDKYYEKAKSGKFSVRDFIYSHTGKLKDVLIKYGLHKSIDFVFHLLSEAYTYSVDYSHLLPK